MLRLKRKISSWNNLLTKLANSSWGADANTLRSTALAVCHLTAEYCAPVWSRSCHARKMDPELNSACRTTTGTLRATPLPTLHRLSGIAPPSTSRDTIARVERYKQLSDPHHALLQSPASRILCPIQAQFYDGETTSPKPVSDLQTGEMDRK